MAMPAGYKPSPLGYGSPRNSPFRRAESPASPTTHRSTTPTPSPTKVGASVGTPSRFAYVSSPTNSTTTAAEGQTPRRQSQVDDMTFSSQPLGSPTAHKTMARAATTTSIGHGNALSQLQPAQVRVLRESFQILDRDSDGVVNREDVMEMLTQLGLPAGASELSPFFPPAGPQTMTLAVFLNSIATGLASMSPSAELLSAFSAFDEDDSGQVDLGELRDALLHTAPEAGVRALTLSEVDRIIGGFSGRRAFSKSMAGGLGKQRGEVFRYQEFVNSIVGGNGSSEPASNDNSEG
ncbi:EF-hand [Biscogniauxia mediterranea]|nr:EF-hand [Biscogniauxia mediterranea]